MTAFTPISALEGALATARAAVLALEEEIRLVDAVRSTPDYVIRQAETERAHAIEAAIRDGHALSGEETCVRTARFLIAMCEDVTYDVPEMGKRLIAFLHSAAELLLMELNKRLVMDNAARPM